MLIDYPHLIAQLDPELNQDVDISLIKAGSHKYLYWYCSIDHCGHGCDHKWKAQIKSRALGKRKCPMCDGKRFFCDHNSFAGKYPELLQEWDYEANNIKPNEVAQSSAIKVNWICKNGHKYSAAISDRTKKKSGCALCKNTSEDILLKFLKQHFENIVIQKSYKDLKGKIALRYDYYLEDFNCLLELDGVQHFEQVLTWASPEQNLIRDLQKTQYALTNNIRIIRMYQPLIRKADIQWQAELISCIKNEMPLQFICGKYESVYGSLKQQLSSSQAI